MSSVVTESDDRTDLVNPLVGSRSGAAQRERERAENESRERAENERVENEQRTRCEFRKMVYGKFFRKPFS
jgi:hypothetical protein